MWVLWTAYMVVLMHRLSISPMAPFLKEAMGLNSTQIGALTSAASFGYMLSIYPSGWATDKLGIRRLLVMGEIIGAVFMIGMFLTPNYTVSLILMAFSGFGCGTILPSTTKGVVLWFPVRERATVMGFKQTALNVGGIITAIVLPWVALTWGWRYGFLILGMVALLIGIVTFYLYKEPPGYTQPGTGQPSISSAKTKATSSRSVTDLMKNRDIWLCTASGFLLGIVEFAVIAHLVLYLTESISLSVVTSGAILALTQAGGAVGKPLGGLLSDRLLGSRRKGVLMLWSGVALISCLLIAFLGSHLSLALYPVLFLLGLGATGWGGVYLTLVAELAGTELAGRATGLVGTFNMAGAIIGPIVFGYIVDTSGSYITAWLFVAICAVICIITLLPIKEAVRE